LGARLKFTGTWSVSGVNFGFDYAPSLLCLLAGWQAGRQAGLPLAVPPKNVKKVVSVKFSKLIS